MTPVSAYSTALLASSSNFIFKLKPDGSLGWSTFFAGNASATRAIALDAAGNPYVAGTTSNGLPTTPGAYETTYLSGGGCGGIGPCFPPTEAFLTKFNAQGSDLLFSTYISKLADTVLRGSAGVLAVNSAGAYVSSGNIVMMNSSGSQLLASQSLAQSGTINAMALDGTGNLYVAGSANSATNNVDAFIVKFDGSLAPTLASTVLGRESPRILAKSIAIDPSSGNVILAGYTDSLSFPTRTPFQASFAPAFRICRNFGSGSDASAFFDLRRR